MFKTVMKIDGMMCPMCEAHINDAIRNAAKVKKVNSSHKKGIAEIISETAPDENALKNAVEKTGYKVIGYESGEYEKKGIMSLFKK